MKSLFINLRISSRLTVIVIAFVVSLLASFSADAQRTSTDQLYLDFTASSSIISSDPSLGGSISIGKYNLSSRWDAGVESFMKRDGTPYFPVYAQASYLLRFCANRSRSAQLYGGLGALAGAELSVPASLTPSTGYQDNENGIGVDFSQVEQVKSGTMTAAFIYGFSLRLEAEFFIARQVALVGSLRMPLTFGSAHKVFNLIGNAGIRINL